MKTGGNIINSLERFNCWISFKKPDRTFFREFSIRKATLKHWHKQGFPKNVNPYDFFGFDRVWDTGLSINMDPIPPYKTRILEKTKRYVTLRDKKGAIVRYFKVHDTGFDTRQWLEFRVKTEKDWEELKIRFNPIDPKRYRSGWKHDARKTKYRDAPLGFQIPGQFWWIRDYVGLHNLLKFFYVKPNLIHEMMDFLIDFLMELMHPLIDKAEVDFIVISEDMAYKTGPMISPRFFKEFMFDNYKRLSRFLKQHGVKLVMWDTDGNPSLLLPLIIDTGINGYVPMEIAAAVDPIEIRKRFPRLVLRGGIDKRVLALGTKKDIEIEVMSKVPALIKRYGYMPTIDHAVAPETPLENYLLYLALLKGLGVGPENLRDKL